VTEANKPPAQDGANPEAENGVGATAAQSEELTAARKEAQTNLEGWQRTLAEFQNYRRRTEREQKDTYTNATQDVLKSLLPIIDDFERAMDSLPADAQGQTWVSGVSMIQRKFRKFLEEYNVQVLDPLGEPFDPNRHEGIGYESGSPYDSGLVAVTLQKGYVVGDRVLRPAIVKVAE
jgi:molecular chaperone GrpE